MPTATLRSPAARRIESSICTVVVLPLVPVTHSHGAACSGSRSRQASSTSPQTGMPRSRACASSGAVGFQPGRGDEQVDVVGQRRGRARAEADVGAEHLEQLGLLGRSLPAAAVGLVERGDAGRRGG